MTKKTHGPRQGTRHVMKKGPRDKTTVNQFLQVFKAGDKVAITIEPSSHSGLMHRRYKGKVGTIMGKRGDAYMVKTHMGNAEKTIITKSEHLRRL